MKRGSPAKGEGPESGRGGLEPFLWGNRGSRRGVAAHMPLFDRAPGEAAERVSPKASADRRTSLIPEPGYPGEAVR